MKIHSTNYIDTFIAVAPDTKAVCGSIPPSKPNKTIAQIQYELIAAHPYLYTSDDVLFKVFAARNDLLPSEEKAARLLLFSKGQACMRTSPLTKTYGYGIHCNKDGKIGIYGMETLEYEQFLSDSTIKKVTAMKSSK